MSAKVCAQLRYPCRRHCGNSRDALTDAQTRRHTIQLPPAITDVWTSAKAARRASCGDSCMGCNTLPVHKTQ